MKIIKSTNGHKILIDDEDFDRVNKYNWTVGIKNGYPYTIHCTSMIISKRILSRFLINPPSKMEVDHIDGNSLNNTKNNLRVCTLQQNRLNKKIYRNNKIGIKGIYLEGSYKGREPYYCAQIILSGKKYKKKSKDLNICIKWRKQKEKELFGEFNRTEKPPHK